MNHFTEEYDFYYVIKSFSLVLVVLYLLCQSITLLTTVLCVVQINTSSNYSSICKVFDCVRKSIVVTIVMLV